MRNKKCGIAVAAALAAGVVAVLLVKKAKQKKISRVVANAGYETAHDIHFPLKINKPRKF